MKKYISIIPATLIIAGILFSCKKTDTKVNPPGQVACSVTNVSSTFAGNNSSSVYEYSTDGKLIVIKNYAGNSLALSTTLGEFSTEVKYTSSSGFSMIQTVVYEGGSIFAGQLPLKASVALQEGMITRTDVLTYYFYYDNKNRLNKVSEETKNVVGDWEYDLFIEYNDQDNVISIKNIWRTGPNTSSTIAVSGYDDKPSPFSGLRTWKYLVSWDNSDPTALFAQLSKNNPLGFIEGDWTREMTYTYNEHGYPLIRSNIQKNKNTEGTATWVETFGYNCP